MHVVRDLSSGTVKVRDIYSRDQRETYASNLPADIIVKPVTARGAGRPANTAATVPADKIASKRAAGTFQKRDRLIPSDCVLPVPPGRIRDIYRELRKLSLENYTNAVSVLFRVFVELSVDTYIKENSMSGMTSDAM